MKMSVVVFTTEDACTIRCDLGGGRARTTTVPSAVKYCEANFSLDGTFAPVGSAQVRDSTTSRGRTIPVFSYRGGGWQTDLAYHRISAGDVEEYMSAVWLHCLQQCVESFEPAWGALAGVRCATVVAPPTATAEDVSRMRKVADSVFGETGAQIFVYSTTQLQAVTDAPPAGALVLDVELCYRSAVAVAWAAGGPSAAGEKVESLQGMRAVEEAFCQELDACSRCDGSGWGTDLKRMARSGQEAWNILNTAFSEHCFPRGSPDDDMDPDVIGGVDFNGVQLDLSGRARNGPYEMVLFSSDDDQQDDDQAASSRSMLSLVRDALTRGTGGAWNRGESEEGTTTLVRILMLAPSAQLMERISRRLVAELSRVDDSLRVKVVPVDVMAIALTHAEAVCTAPTSSCANTGDDEEAGVGSEAKGKK